MILSLLYAGVGVAASVLLLKRLQRGSAEEPFLHHLGGKDLFVGLLLWMICIPMILEALPSLAALGDNKAHPKIVLKNSLAGLSAWAWLAYRSKILWPIHSDSSQPWRWGIHCALASLPGFLGLSMLGTSLAELTGGNSTQEVVTGFGELSWSLRLPTLVLVVLVVPVIEEVLFRGWLWGFLTSRAGFGSWRALLFTTLVFTLMHEPSAWPSLLFLGGILGWVRWQSGQLRYAILFHTLYNAVGCMLPLIFT